MNESLRWDSLRRQQQLRELPYFNAVDEYSNIKGQFACRDLEPRVARDNVATRSFEESQRFFKQLDDVSFWQD